MTVETTKSSPDQAGTTAERAAAMLAILRAHDNMVVVAHGSPDGDAMGACGAMALILQALGKRFAIYNATGFPEYLSWAPLPGPVTCHPQDLPFRPGLLVILDCGDQWRIGRELSAVFADYPSINIDHHLSNPEFGSLGNWVDPDMAATGQMVAAIADAAGLPLSGDLGLFLYLSILSDTGAFSHGNTSAAVFRLAARLAEAGLDVAAVRAQLENQWTLAKTRLWARLFERTRLELDGRLALCAVSFRDLAETGTTREDMEGFVEQLRKIRGVRVSLLLREDEGNFCKFSLRSTGTDDVRAVAARFGGGGHLNAAGATIQHSSADDLTRQLLAAIREITFQEHAV